MKILRISLVVCSVHCLSYGNATNFSLADYSEKNLCQYNSLCVGPTEKLQYKFCKCDEDCVDYSDCCLDASGYEPLFQIQNSNEWECVDTGYGGHHYMKTGCEAEWADTKISSLCAAAKPGNFKNDFLLDVPVTSNITHKIYPNYYCAVCNNDAGALDTWDLVSNCYFTSREEWEQVFRFFELEMSVSEDNDTSYGTNLTEFTDSRKEELYKQLSQNRNIQGYIRANLIYSEKDKRFVFPINQDNKQTNHSCTISLEIPSEARECEDALLHTCAIDWHCKLTDYFCQLYIYPMVHRSSRIVYRNPHCAFCNHVPVDKLMCYFKVSAYIPPLLSVLLSMPDTSNAEVTSFCGEGESFIPAYRSCQSTICRLSSEIHRKGVCLNKTILTFSHANMTELGIAATWNYALVEQSNGSVSKTSYLSWNLRDFYLLIIPHLFFILVYIE